MPFCDTEKYNWAGTQILKFNEYIQIDLPKTVPPTVWYPKLHALVTLDTIHVLIIHVLIWHMKFHTLVYIIVLMYSYIYTHIHT